jgi:hypothetical protein
MGHDEKPLAEAREELAGVDVELEDGIDQIGLTVSTGSEAGAAAAVVGPDVPVGPDVDGRRGSPFTTVGEASPVRDHGGVGVREILERRVRDVVRRGAGRSGRGRRPGVGIRGRQRRAARPHRPASLPSLSPLHLRPVRRRLRKAPGWEPEGTETISFQDSWTLAYASSCRGLRNRKGGLLPVPIRYPRHPPARQSFPAAAQSGSRSQPSPAYIPPVTQGAGTSCPGDSILGRRNCETRSGARGDPQSLVPANSAYVFVQGIRPRCPGDSVRRCRDRGSASPSHHPHLPVPCESTSPGRDWGRSRSPCDAVRGRGDRGSPLSGSHPERTIPRHVMPLGEGRGTPRPDDPIRRGGNREAVISHGHPQRTVPCEPSNPIPERGGSTGPDDPVRGCRDRRAPSAARHPLRPIPPERLAGGT